MRCHRARILSAIIGVLLSPACTSRPAHEAITDATLPEVPATLDVKILSEEFDRLSETKTTRNAVTLLHLGMRSAPERERIMRGAKEYIFQTVPYWYDDEEGRRFRDVYKEQLAGTPGLDARIIVDWTSPGSTGDLFARKMYSSLKEVTGGKILQWNEPWWGRRFSAQIGHNRMHDKLLVVDGRHLIMGGMNVGVSYLQGGRTRDGWHDTDILIEGPAAQEAAKIFVKLWESSRYLSSSASFPSNEKDEVAAFRNIWKDDRYSFTWEASVDPKTGHALKPNDPARNQKVEIPVQKYLDDPKYFPKLEADPKWTVPVRIIYDNPLVDRDPVTLKHYSKVMRSLQYLVKASRKHALLFLPYLTPEPGFIETLKNAAKRGVLVAIVTNSERSHDIGKVPWKAGTALYSELIKAGVHIFEWQGHQDLLELEKKEGCTIPDGSWPGKTIHSKVVVVDGYASLVGSHNMNARSEAYNSEVMASIASKEFAAQIHKIFEDDADLVPEKRTIQCGDRIVPRPPKTEYISLEKASKLDEVQGKKARFLQQLRAAM